MEAGWDGNRLCRWKLVEMGLPSQAHNTDTLFPPSKGNIGPHGPPGPPGSPGHTVSISCKILSRFQNNSSKAASNAQDMSFLIWELLWNSATFVSLFYTLVIFFMWLFLSHLFFPSYLKTFILAVFHHYHYFIIAYPYFLTLSLFLSFPCKRILSLTLFCHLLLTSRSSFHLLTLSVFP